MPATNRKNDTNIIQTKLKIYKNKAIPENKKISKYVLVAIKSIISRNNKNIKVCIGCDQDNHTTKQSKYPSV